MAIVNYKCPNCSAGLNYDAGSSKMTCEFCGGIFSVEELETMYADEIQAEKENDTWSGFEPKEWQTQDMKGMSMYQCPSCGAEIIAEESTGAMKCPYCDNPTIIPKQFEGIFKPDYILPFKLDKKAAVKALKNLYKGKKFLPNAFSEENHIQELTGMYVPFWLFDTKAFGDYVFDGTRTSHHVEGKYDVTRIDHFLVRRAGEVTFTRVPVDGAASIDNVMMESIEPYHYTELEPFQYSYLSGYVANKYDKEPDELTERVYERVQDSTRLELEKAAMGYDSLLPLSKYMEVDKSGKVQYVLLPVWFLNTTWNGQKYTFVMNGQTGKMCGDLPVDKSKYWKYFVRMAAMVTIPLTAIMTLLSVL